MEVGCPRHPGTFTIAIGSQLLRLLSWQANCGKPVMSPHAVRGTGTRHFVETMDRGRERGGRGTAWAMSCHATKNARRKHLLYAMLQSTGRLNSDTCACVGTVDYRGTQALFVDNSVKLHLTASYSHFIFLYNLNYLFGSWPFCFSISSLGSVFSEKNKF